MVPEVHVGLCVEKLDSPLGKNEQKWSKLTPKMGYWCKIKILIMLSL